MKPLLTFRWRWLAGALALAAALLAPSAALRAQTNPPATDPLTTLSAFTGTNGLNPGGAPVQAADGTFYGTTQNGGANGYGTFYHRTADGTTTALYSFGNVDPTTGNVLDGQNPNTTLIQGLDGAFYGVTPNGGAFYGGTVYKVVTDGTVAGTTFTVLHDFVNNTDGVNPQTSLLLAQDGLLYGTTNGGGSNDNGTIFSLSTDGATYANLYSFDSNALGYYAQSPLVEGPAGTFYGAAQYGGPSGRGSLFTFTAANGVAATPTVVHAFDNNYDSGFYPYGNLVLDGGVIYGTTQYGGPYRYYGAIYAISTDGTTRVTTPLYGFTYADANGYRPQGGLTLAGGKLYGTTQSGGSIGNGTVFSAAEDGSALTIVHNFAGSTDGSSSFSPLTVSTDGTTLYGVAANGGASGQGTLFQFPLDGSSFTVLNNFYLDRAYSEAALVQGADGAFYGTTQNGGTNNQGTVFRVDANGTITTLHAFTGGGNNNIGLGAARTAAIKQPGTRSHRRTRAAAQPGVVSAADGAYPNSALILATDGFFYGTTINGGDNDDGTVFRISADGTTFTTIYSFDGTNGGSNPSAGVIRGTDGLLYGTAQSGGTNGSNGGYGTVFSLSTDGATFTLLHTFAGSPDGNQPVGGLVQGTDGAFYGTTQNGGTNDQGTVFRVTADGTAFTTLHSMNSTTDGQNPVSALVVGPDGLLYGSAQYGGQFGNGTVFRVSTDGATFRLLHSFNRNVDGYNPSSALTLSQDGFLYGTTVSGAFYGSGSVYRLGTGGDFTLLYSFRQGNNNNNDIAVPGGSSVGQPAATSPNLTTPTNSADGSPASLIEGPDGFFYGTSDRGGTSGYGSVYRLSVPPVITSTPGVNAQVGVPFTYTVTAFHHPTAFSATGLPAGLTIDPVTGIVSGTPTTAGTVSGTVSASDTGGTDTEPFVVFVTGAVPTITSGAPPAGQVGTAYSYQITASNSPTSYGASGLPPGLTITPATGLISGTPTAAGSYGVTVLATNTGGTSTASFALTILPLAPVITSAASANAVTNQVFSYQITASNNPTSFAASGLPAGLSINPTVGFISGTPTAAGTFAVTISATNAGGTSTGTLNLVVSNAPVATPTINSAASASATVGTAFAYQISASNNPTSFTATGLPTGLTVNTATGLISGTPSVPGSYTVALSATNVAGPGTANLALTVLAATTPPSTPAITSAASANSQTGTPFTYQITASGSPTSFAATGLPNGLTVSPATGLISGTPTATGSFSVTLSATGTGGTGTATLTLTVTTTTVATSTITSPASANAQAGQAFSYQITGTNNPTSFAATGLPNGLGINTATGLISGTPVTAGVYMITLSAINPGGTSTASVTLTVTAAALVVPVVTSPASAAGQVAVAFSYQIAASDNPVFFGASNLPAGLAINDATGLIAGTPTAAGTFTVNLMATNSAGTGTGTLTLTIAAQPLPVISLIASVPSVRLGTGELAEFAVTRTGGDETQTLVVNYAVSGNATPGVDYVALKGTKTFKSGKTTVRINVTPTGTLNGAAKKGVKLTIQPGDGYTLGTATTARVNILAAQ